MKDLFIISISVVVAACSNANGVGATCTNINQCNKGLFCVTGKCAALASTGSSGGTSTGSSTGGQQKALSVSVTTPQTPYAGIQQALAASTTSGADFSWSVTSAPQGSKLAGQTASGATFTFTPDFGGEYDFHVEATLDLQSGSADATVTVLTDSIFLNIADGATPGLTAVQSDGTSATVIDAKIGSGDRYGFRRLSGGRLAYVAYDSTSNEYALRIATPSGASWSVQTWVTTSPTTTADSVGCTWDFGATGTASCEFPIRLFGNQVNDHLLAFDIGKGQIPAAVTLPMGDCDFVMDTSASSPNMTVTMPDETTPAQAFINTGDSTDDHTDLTVDATGTKFVLAYNESQAGDWGSPVDATAGTLELITATKNGSFFNQGTITQATPPSGAYAILRPQFLANGNIVFARGNSSAGTQSDEFITLGIASGDFSSGDFEKMLLVPAAPDTFLTKPILGPEPFTDFSPIGIGDDAGANAICTKVGATSATLYATPFTDAPVVFGDKVLIAHASTTRTACTTDCMKTSSYTCETNPFTFDEHALLLYDADTAQTTDLTPALSAAGLSASGDYYYQDMQFIAGGAEVALLAVEQSDNTAKMFVVNINASNAYSAYSVALPSGATKASGPWDDYSTECSSARTPELLIAALAAFGLFIWRRKKRDLSE